MNPNFTQAYAKRKSSVRLVMKCREFLENIRLKK